MRREVDFETFQAYVLTNFSKHGKKRRNADFRNLAIATMGLAGESGEVVNHFKKIVRDFDANPAKYPPKKMRELLLEFGDVFHYFVFLMNRAGLTLPEVMAANIKKLDRRHGRAPRWTKGKAICRG
jgi:NTP pyrophosphatase (non-canonical NTP hydrolase)